jgi:hypothetical protein
VSDDLYDCIWALDTLINRLQKKGKGLPVLKKGLEKIIYFVFTILIFFLLWKVTGIFWNAFVPWNLKTDLIALFVVAPLLIILAFVLSSLPFKVIIRGKRV